MNLGHQAASPKGPDLPELGLPNLAATVGIVNLGDAARGQVVTVDQVSLGEALARRLAELGVRRGQQVSVSHRTAGGGRVVKVEDTRIALDARTVAAIGVTAAPIGVTDPAASPNTGQG